MTADGEAQHTMTVVPTDDGRWRAECECGGYRSHTYSTRERAEDDIHVERRWMRLRPHQASE